MMENEGGQSGSGFDVMKLYFSMSILSFLMHYQKNPTLFAVTNYGTLKGDEYRSAHK